MNISLIWKPVQWITGIVLKIAEWFKPKSAAEKLAEAQFKERECDARALTFFPQIQFAFSQLAHENPESNLFLTSQLADSLHLSLGDMAQIIDSLVRQGKLIPVTDKDHTYYQMADFIRPQRSR